MIRSRYVLVLLPCMLTAFSVCSVLGQPTIKQDTARRAQSLNGADTFGTYCAVCHGVDGKGNGPAAAGLKSLPADLTTYAKRHNATFSHADITKVIEGERPIAAHGSREMPVWGDVFRALYNDRKLRDLLVKNLLDHIESMQVQ